MRSMGMTSFGGHEQLSFGLERIVDSWVFMQPLYI